MEGPCLPDCVLALIFAHLDADGLRTVPLVSLAWRAAEHLTQELLWARFAPGWPPSSAKEVAVHSLLFESRQGQVVDIDALALEAPRGRMQPPPSAQCVCDLPARLFRRLSPLFWMGPVLDALAPRRFKCLIAGPKHSGKTRVLDTLCRRPGHYAERAGVLHVEMLMVGGAQVQLWEGTDGLILTQGTDGLIYVCDGRAGADDAAMLQRLLAVPELATVPVLVVASKQDLMRRSPAQTVTSLGLLTRRSLRWRVQPCSLPTRSVSALRGCEHECRELHQGLGWLAQAMRDESRSSPNVPVQRIGSLGSVCWWLVR